MRVRELTTYRVDDHPNLLILRAVDEDGNEGLGETFIGAEAVETVIHTDLAQRILGSEIRGVPARSDLLAGYVGFNGTGAESRARSAIDLALWDLAARGRGVSVAEALGGAVRDSIRTYNTCAGPGYTRARHHRTTIRNWGLAADDASRTSYEDLQWFMEDAGGLARSLLSEGLTGMKIWPFDPAAERTQGQHITDAELDRALDPFRRIRAAVGDEMDIKVELHGLWNLPSAMRILHALEPFRPTWVEDPIRPDDVEALRRLRASTSIPIAVGETIGGLHEYRDLIARGGADVIIVDLSWCGGLTEALRVATLAAAWHLPVAVHDCVGPISFAAAVQFSLHVQNVFVQESVRAYVSGWYRDVAVGLPVIEDGLVRAGDGPGLGVRLVDGFASSPGVHSRTTSV